MTVPCVSVYVAVTPRALFLAIVPSGHSKWGALGANDAPTSLPGPCGAEIAGPSTDAPVAVGQDVELTGVFVYLNCRCGSVAAWGIVPSRLRVLGVALGDCGSVSPMVSHRAFTGWVLRLGTGPRVCTWSVCVSSSSRSVCTCDRWCVPQWA